MKYLLSVILSPDAPIVRNRHDDFPARGFDTPPALRPPVLLSVDTESPSQEEEVMAQCPECEAQVSVDAQPQVSEIVQCAECSAELEVVTVSPLALAVAPDVEEDWGE
jgi:alpha-aminoadipate/glutamate carrier protein LysW